MPSSYQISLDSARALHLSAQGLLKNPRRQPTKDDVLECIRRMSALQIDTISVVARSPYLVLWSRLGAYPAVWLDELLAEKKLFEYWSHEACFLPIEDYGLYRHQMISPDGMGWKFNHRWQQEHQQEIIHLRDFISQNGPVRSVDFERQDGKAGGWWEWKPEKRSLEVLFTTGQLMVAQRRGFQRVYDLRERVHPAWNDEIHLPTRHDAEKNKILLSVKALGVAKASWIKDYFRLKSIGPDNHPDQLCRQGLLVKIKVDSWDQPAYVHPDHLEQLELAADKALKANSTRILSPFDPVVWDRKRAADLFGFEYRLECYTPAPKRQYGYFCLPILRNGKLIARIDAKAHRKQQIMEIKSLFLEADVRISDALAADLMKVIREFAAWHACTDVHFSPADITPFVRRMLAF